MNKRKNSFKVAVMAMFLQMMSTLAAAQNAVDEQVLDGTTINWSYVFNGSGMTLSFEDGLAQYKWITGSRKGRSAKDIPYRSREINDGVYFINWVQPEKPDFITLLFNFNENTVYSSGLIGYGTDRQRNLFLEGVIESVEP